MTQKYRKHFIWALLLTLLLLSTIFAFNIYRDRNIDVPNQTNSSVKHAPFPEFTATELSRHDGHDVSLPIYIGLDGYVFDVSLGRKYYQEGGVYHYLAGKDSSKSLHIMGGDIIKQKYPVIGVLKSD